MNLHKTQPFSGIERSKVRRHELGNLGTKLLEKILAITGYFLVYNILIAAALRSVGAPLDRWYIAFIILDSPFIYAYWRYALRYLPVFNAAEPIVCGNCRKLTLGKRVSRIMVTSAGKSVCTTCAGPMLALQGVIGRANLLADDATTTMRILRNESINPPPIVENPPKEGDPEHAIGS